LVSDSGAAGCEAYLSVTYSRVRSSSSSVIGIASSTANAQITASGSASVFGTCTVLSVGNATYSDSASVNCIVSYTIDAVRIGDNWADVAENENVWTDVSTNSNVWTQQSNGNNTWLQQN
jgi:hypothetical protein